MLDPSWIDDCIRQQRLLPLENYRVHSQRTVPLADLDFDHLTLDTPMKKLLYTPTREPFEQDVDHPPRLITLENLGMNLPGKKKKKDFSSPPEILEQLIHRYGGSVARRQAPKSSVAVEEVFSESFPSQSQSSAMIHFVPGVRRGDAVLPLSPSRTFDFDNDEALLLHRPQSTPIDRWKSVDYSSFTRVSPLPSSSEVDVPRPPPLLALSQAIRRKRPEDLRETNSLERFPSKENLPHLLANHSFVFYRFSPPCVSPSLLVRHLSLFSSLLFRALEEAKRLTRRMGDSFSFESIDLSTTHILLPNDDPQLPISLELLLGAISGW